MNNSRESSKKLDKVEMQAMKQEIPRRILIVSSVALIGVLATLLTGFLVDRGQCAPGLPSGCYGFPLSWRYWVELLDIHYF